MKSTPLISIVTVSYNAVLHIEETILSVINQTYPNIEYIIIDGGSTDGTIDIIKKYEDKIAYWISEPDKGIYDAMNKGIDVATGEWINFMNVGDSFYSNTVIAEINWESLDNKMDVIYGDTCIIAEFGRYEEYPLPLAEMSNKIPFCHQSCFSKLNHMKQYKFDENYRICADYNFFYNLWKLNKIFEYIPITIANYNRSIESLSGDNRLITYRETLRISNTYTISKYLRFKIRYLIGVIFRCILPFSLIVKKRKLVVENNQYTKKVSWE